ncbi:MAG: hypothetical protein RLZZ618_201 [Pseudomonadota bacterium]
MRILYLATADARGHLMRAQLLTHALRAAGVEVQLVTTSHDGVRFLQAFGLEAELLSTHYAVQFDACQNMLRRETDRNVAHYVFRPNRMARDIWQLHRWMRDCDLVVNDSFHPALLNMGAWPGWRRKIVHVYGASLRRALESNFKGRVPFGLAGVFQRVIALQLARSRARLEHDFAFEGVERIDAGGYRLPTPVEVVSPSSPDVAGPSSCGVAVYLNPHFTEPMLAEALERGFAMAGVASHKVGEGYASRSGWQARDAQWVQAAARSDLIVTAPGMAGLSIALVYRRPLLLVLTDQPEQAQNAQRARELGLLHEVVVWQGERDAFAAAVAASVCRLTRDSKPAASVDGRQAAAARLAAWVALLRELAGVRTG